MTDFLKAFEFFAPGASFMHNFDEWNKLPFPAYVRQPMFEFKTAEIPEIQFSYGKQTLAKGPLLGLGSTVDEQTYLLSRRLKDAMRSVVREHTKTLLDSQVAMNPYGFQRESVATRYVELDSYGVFSKLGQILEDFLASQERVGQFWFTAVSFGRSSLTATVRCLLEKQFEARRKDLAEKGDRLPIKVLNVFPSEEVSPLHPARSGEPFQVFEARQPGPFGSVNAAECRLQFLSLVASFTADLGAKFLLVDYCDAPGASSSESQEELSDLLGLTRVGQFLRGVQLAVTPGVVQSGGFFVLRTREVYGCVFREAVQFLGGFYEEVTLAKPFYSQLLSSDRVLVLGKKRRVDFKKAGEASRQLEAEIGRLEARIAAGELTVPVELDEEFEHLASILKPGTRQNDAWAAYIRRHNSAVLHVQATIQLYQFVHFAASCALHQEPYYRDILADLSQEFALAVSWDALAPENFAPGRVFPRNEHRVLLRQAYLQQVTGGTRAFQSGFTGTIGFVLGEQNPTVPNKWATFAIDQQKKAPVRLTVRAEQREVERLRQEQLAEQERQRRAEEKLRLKALEKTQATLQKPAAAAEKVTEVEKQSENKRTVEKNAEPDKKAPPAPPTVKEEPPMPMLPNNAFGGGAFVLPLPDDPPAPAPSQPRQPRDKKQKKLLDCFK